MMRLSDFRLAVRLGTYTPPMTGILCGEISRLRFASLEMTGREISAARLPWKKKMVLRVETSDAPLAHPH